MKVKLATPVFGHDNVAQVQESEASGEMVDIINLLRQEIATLKEQVKTLQKVVK